LSEEDEKLIKKAEVLGIDIPRFDRLNPGFRGKSRTKIKEEIELKIKDGGFEGSSCGGALL